MSPIFNHKKLDKSNIPHKNLNLFFKQNKLRKSQSLKDEDSNKDKPKISTLVFNNNFKFKKRKSVLLINEDIQESEKRKKEYDYYSYVLINQIIKFKDNKKKEITKKEATPMQFGKEYQDFINRRNKLNFNPNFNSAYIHKVNSNYMIKKILLKKRSGFNTVKDKLNINFGTKQDTEGSLELELRDKVEPFSSDMQKFKKSIKIYFANGIKLNQKAFHEKFFDKYENKVNFLFDDQRFPTIKNKLNKIIIDIKTAGAYEWKLLNMIENSTLTYLHKLTAKIQRELDEIEEKENKEKQHKINQQIGKYDINSIKKMRKKSILNIMNENANYENIKNINDHIKHIVNVLKIENESEDEIEKANEEAHIDSVKEDMYNLEEFFVNKRGKYKAIDFANDKLTDIVYNSPKFYKEYYYNNSHEENYKSIKELKNLDLFL